MTLYAISDLHLGYEINRQALAELPPHPGDWLILAGDMGDTPPQLQWALESLAPKFERLIWVPGNHELWTLPLKIPQPRGVELYETLVDICRRYDVLTPEDPFAVLKGAGPDCVIAPLFLLYDYTFRPDHVPPEGAVEWAMESDVLCADESYLLPDPYPTREAWCHARCDAAERRLAEIPPQYAKVLVNHFPLRYDLVWLPRVPRFSIWCGTRRTENWHRKYRATVVVSGHLHVRSTQYRDGVRFEEVSLGYPKQWRPKRGIEAYLREILPGPE